MSDTIQFELVSPERKMFSEPVKMAVIPGEEGRFGVLPGHSALVAALKAGVVELEIEGQDNRKIFIAGGFADVTSEQCTVLAEEAINVADINKVALEQDIANLTEDLAAAVDKIDQARIQKRLQLAGAKMQAAHAV